MYLMLDPLLTYADSRSLLTVAVLVVVLLGDFLFRRNLYDRSDPLSFSILGYSFLLVIPIVLLQMIHGGKRNETEQNIAFLYILCFFIIFLLTREAHKRLIAKQQERVVSYLNGLRRTANANNMIVADGVWDALEELGKWMIEPIAFRQSGSKSEKRDEYFRLVNQYTRCQLAKPEDQADLRIVKGQVLWWARVCYSVSLCVGVISTLYFYRSH